MFINWPYQTNRVILLPYVREKLPFPDDFLYTCYTKTKEQGLLDICFPGIPEMNLDKFMGCMLNNQTQVYLIKNGETPVTAGYCFVYNINGGDGARLANFGFMFFKEFQAKRETRDLVWLCLAYWFKELKIDVLYGITLTSNRLAQNFSRKFGFTNLGKHPKFLSRGDHRVDANVVVLEKDDFIPLFDEWHKQKLAEMNDGKHQGRDILNREEREGHSSGLNPEL